MDPKNIRKVYAPYSTTGEQVGQTPLTGYVDVAQAIYPAVNTGQISTDGEWSGVVVTDKTFRIDATHFGIADNGETLNPQSQPDFIDMTGYTDIFIAVMGTRSGNCIINAIMGPDTNTFANLTPVNAGTSLKGTDGSIGSFSQLFNDTSEALTADVWNIFSIQGVLAGQKNLQFKITNTAGGSSDITFAYLRVA